jgi:NitT/TauT family transport system substrate-binding protein
MPGRRWLLRAAAAAVVLSLGPARAEVAELRIAQQFGITYLPLTIAKNRRLIEAEAAKLGLAGLKVSWVKLGSGSAMNDALLSGSVEVAAGGTAPLLKIWDKTRDRQQVRGIAALGAFPLYLVTTNPAVRSVRDFGPQDRIALPAVKVSIQAILLQMAAAEAFGPAGFDRLDTLTVSMVHPDAMSALLSLGTEITAHFANPPFQEEELRHPRVHRVVSSYDLLGEPATVNSAYAAGAFARDNPRTLAALVAALDEACRIARADRREAARIYVEEDGDRRGVEAIAGILENPEIQPTIAPQAMMRYARFMHEHGQLSVLPASWKDVYFAPLHHRAGS